VTSADFAWPIRPRPFCATARPAALGALVPSIHIAVITADQIVADMKELFALLRWDERYCQEGLSNYVLHLRPQQDRRH
jgi:hypothetical protein